MATFAARLRSLRNRKGMTQREVAEKLGISESAYGYYEQGRRQPPQEAYPVLADLFDVSLDYLLTGNTRGTWIAGSYGAGKTAFMLEALAKMRAEDSQRNVEVTLIPVLGTIKAGYDLYADQQVIDYKPAATADVADGEYFYLVVKGDSMIEDGIKEGMRVLVRRQDWVDEGKIGVVLINGDEATLKRVFYDGGNIILQASNAAYKPRVLPIEDAKIQGQVTQVVWDV